MQNVNNTDDNNHITPFAVTNWRDIRKIFGIKRKNRRGHMYVIGKTGTGKSTLIENMVISDIKNGSGVALIDPHGDLAENILNFIPEERIEDVVYFNPADMERPIAFNPLKSVLKDYHHLVASGLISVFKKIWSDFWGPRLEHILRYSILTILEYQNTPEGKAGKIGTLLDIPRILTNKEFRQAVMQKITNEQVREFWQNEFDTYSAWLRSQAISPILNKIGQFLSTTPIRNIVSQKENTFDIRDVMDEGKILIVNLSKGKIGEDNCALLGAMIVTEIQLAALSRADMPENKRRAFYVFVDEVHNFLTLSFADILSECRKYGLNLTLAHQYIEQLDEKMRAAIFGNVGTIISFRVGVTDAQYLSKEFHPVFNETDLVNLPNHNICLKLMIEGITSDAFSAMTLPPPESNISYKERIINLSREIYGKKREKIEGEMVYATNIKTNKQAGQGKLFE